MSLKQWDIKNGDFLFVAFVPKNCTSQLHDPDGWESNFAMNDWWKPIVLQTDAGMSAFLSTLFVVVSSMLYLAKYICFII